MVLIHFSATHPESDIEILTALILPIKEKKMARSECMAVSSCMLMLKWNDFAWGSPDPRNTVWEEVR